MVNKIRKKKLKKILSDFLSITMSVLDDRPQTATKEEYYNRIKTLFNDLNGLCKKCSYNKKTDCFYKCKGFKLKKGEKNDM